MEPRERLFRVLKILANSSRGVLALTTLMQKAGYGKLRDFRRDLHELKRLGLVDLQRSGFPSDSQMHRKIAVLTADVITIHPEREAVEYLPHSDESIEIRFNPHRDSDDLYDLVKIRSPLGTESYMNRKDYEQLRKHRTDILGVPTKHRLRAVSKTQGCVNLGL